MGNRSAYVSYNGLHYVDPTGHFFKKLWNWITHAWNQNRPQPDQLQWWADRLRPPSPIHPRTVVQFQQTLNSTASFLIDKWGLSPATASAVIAGALALPMGGGAVIAATGAYLTVKAGETEVVQNAIDGLASALEDLGMSSRAARSASEQFISFGISYAIGFGLSSAANGIVQSLSRFEGLQGNTIQVRHYTNATGRNTISKGRTLREGTFVTRPSEIPSGATRQDIKRILELRNTTRARHSVDLTINESDLIVPGNGSTTSSGAWQRVLKRDVPINPEDFQTHGQ